MLQVSKKLLFAGAVGNILETYVYTIWGLLSIYLTQAFLPPHTKLSEIFWLFLLTYFLRPLGGLVFGIYADQLGRKSILKLSILVMGIATLLVGFIPNYHSIGILATYLLIFIRLIQILAVSGEYISSISLLIESCEKDEKGYFGSWVSWGVNVGMLLASLVAALLIYLIEHHFIPEWGWRLAFVFAFFTMLLGFWIRRGIPESFGFIQAHALQDEKSFLGILQEGFSFLKSHILESLTVFILVWFGTAVTILLFVYVPLYLTTVNHLTELQALAINSVSLFFIVLMIPFFGRLSDKYGRIKIILISIISLIVLITFYFSNITSGEFLQVLSWHILIGIPCASIFSMVPVLITEIFPLAIRCSMTSFIYSLAVCLGGGITPLLAFRFEKFSHPSYWLSLLVTLIGTLSVIVLFALQNKYRRNKIRLIYKNSV